MISKYHKKSKYLRNSLKKKIVPRLYNLPVSKNLKLKLLNFENPEIILKVKLNEIKLFLKNSHLEEIFTPNKVKKTHVPGFVWDGDWDLKTESIDKYHEKGVAYRSIFQIFKEGRHYKDCDEYKLKEAQINENIYSVRGHSIEELNHYFESLIELKSSIENDGYLSQRDLNQKKNDDEIGVFVDRNGKLIKPENNFSGTHRFAIAKALNLPFVYVNVVAVHKIWAEQNLERIINNKEKPEPNNLFNTKE